MSKSVFPAIVTEDQWRTATAIVKDPTRRSAFDSKVKHLLAGMMLCGKCGAPMKTSSRGGVEGSNRHYYKCPTSGKGHSFQTATPVEELITETVLEVLGRPEYLATFAPNNDGELDQLQSQAVTLRGRLEESADSYADGPITGGQLAAITARGKPRLELVEKMIAAIGNGNFLAGIDTEDIPSWWEAASIEKHRAVIDALMVITVDVVGKSAPRVFHADRIRISWKHAESQNADV